MKIALKLLGNTFIPASKEDAERIQDFRKQCIYEVDIKVAKRTNQQNRSIHKYCEMIANTLNNEKMVIQDVIKINTSWDMLRAKELIFKAVVKHLYNKDSTTKLNKDELDKVIDTITLYLGEKGVVAPAFPTSERE